MGYADLGNRYRNPILFADYSDPDVIRVGDTYYLTASSFNYTPGLPILAVKKSAERITPLLLPPAGAMRLLLAPPYSFGSSE